MEFREKVIQHYRQQLQDKIDAFRDRIAALSEDSRNDAKGSAGDKHETALSMMHIEQEKASRKLAEFLEQKAVLDRIDRQPVPSRIALGSLFTANEIGLFVSAALPKITVDGRTVMAFSPASPLGRQVLGKQEGDQFEMGGSVYRIGQLS